jgi:hypothetical protein
MSAAAPWSFSDETAMVHRGKKKGHCGEKSKKAKNQALCMLVRGRGAEAFIVDRLLVDYVLTLEPIVPFLSCFAVPQTLSSCDDSLLEGRFVNI